MIFSHSPPRNICSRRCTFRCADEYGNVYAVNPSFTFAYTLLYNPSMPYWLQGGKRRGLRTNVHAAAYTQIWTFYKRQRLCGVKRIRVRQRRLRFAKKKNLQTINYEIYFFFFLVEREMNESWENGA